MGEQGPDGVELVYADMTHDESQWRSSATHLEEARRLAATEASDHPDFGVYADIVQSAYVTSATAVRDFLRDGSTASGTIADLIDANTQETSSNDTGAGSRVRTAGGGGSPGGGSPGGGLPGGGGPGDPQVGAQPLPGGEQDKAPLWLRDRDHDGRPDVLEDEDHDGVLDVWETGRDGTPRIWRDHDHDGRPDIFADRDGDGVADVLQDTDHDGTPDLLEDEDGDGRYDVWKDVQGAPPSVADADGDGVPDLWEDTDGDGVVDIAEDEDLDGVPDALQRPTPVPDGPSVPQVDPTDGAPTDTPAGGAGGGDVVTDDPDTRHDEHWTPATRRAHGGEWS